MADIAASWLDLKLIAPERVLSEQRATMVVLPGAEGQLGILPGHAPLIVLLQPGLVTVESSDTSERFFVAGGFAEVAEGANGQPTQLTILADEALPLAELQATAIQAEIANLEGELTEAEAAARVMLLSRLTVAQAKLAATQAAQHNPIAA